MLALNYGGQTFFLLNELNSTFSRARIVFLGRMGGGKVNIILEARLITFSTQKCHYLIKVEFINATNAFYFVLLNEKNIASLPPCPTRVQPLNYEQK